MGDRRIVLGLFAGAVLSPLILGRGALPWGLGLGAVLAVWQLWAWWQRRKEARSVVGALRAHWAELPGGRVIDRVVYLHDGDHPIGVRVGREGSTLTAAISAVVPEAPAAFRVWPIDNPPPPISADGAVGGPRVERSALIEQFFAGRMHFECNDEQLAHQMVDRNALAALFVVLDQGGDAFRGATYDGRRLTVHLAGPVVADRDRATQLARPVWRAFVP